MSRKRVNKVTSQAWRDFHATTEGRAALAALLVHFDFYTSPATNDPTALIRHQGQRDVLLAIIGLVGMKEDAATQNAWDDTDLLDRIMRQHV